MPRTHRFILAQTLVLAGLALAPLRAEEEAPLSEPQVVLTDAVDLGESLLVAPATASEQLDAADLRLKQFYSCAIHPSTTNYFLAGAQDNGARRSAVRATNVPL